MMQPMPVRWRKEVKESGQQAFPGHGVLKLPPLRRREHQAKCELAFMNRGERNLKKGGDRLLKRNRNDLSFYPRDVSGIKCFSGLGVAVLVPRAKRS